MIKAIPSSMQKMWDEVEQRLTASGYDKADTDAAFFAMTKSAGNELMLTRAIESCKNCPLEAGCRGPVKGIGHNRSRVMIVGEAPGEQEDIYGLPLIGDSGALLTLVLAKLGVDRDRLYLTNAVKCRPDNNRTPHKDEIDACMQHLINEIQVVQPSVIITMGNVAMQALRSDTKLKITKERGTWQQGPFLNGNTEMIHTYHPSYLLRLSGDDLSEKKREFWNDLSDAFTKAKQRDPDFSYQGNLVELAP